jgi:hypothetical protein
MNSIICRILDAATNETLPDRVTRGHHASFFAVHSIAVRIALVLENALSWKIDSVC